MKSELSIRSPPAVGENVLRTGSSLGGSRRPAVLTISRADGKVILEITRLDCQIIETDFKSGTLNFIAHALLGQALSDGRPLPEEISFYFTTMRVDYDLTPSSTLKLLQEVLSQRGERHAHPIVQDEFTREQREEILYRVWGMSLVDGELADEEVSYSRGLRGILFPEESVV